MQGPAGPTGPTGIVGIRGRQGPVGRDGDAGSVGIQGPTGAEGRRGFFGPSLNPVRAQTFYNFLGTNIVDDPRVVTPITFTADNEDDEALKFSRVIFLDGFPAVTTSGNEGSSQTIPGLKIDTSTGNVTILRGKYYIEAHGSVAMLQDPFPICSLVLTPSGVPPPATFSISFQGPFVESTQTCHLVAYLEVTTDTAVYMLQYHTFSSGTSPTGFPATLTATPSSAFLGSAYPPDPHYFASITFLQLN